MRPTNTSQSPGGISLCTNGTPQASKPASFIHLLQPFCAAEQPTTVLVKIQPDDVIFHLGDLALGKKEDTEALVPLLNGKLLKALHFCSGISRIGFKPLKFKISTRAFALDGLLSTKSMDSVWLKASLSEQANKP